MHPSGQTGIRLEQQFRWMLQRQLMCSAQVRRSNAIFGPTTKRTRRCLRLSTTSSLSRNHDNTRIDFRMVLTMARHR